MSEEKASYHPSPSAGGSDSSAPASSGVEEFSRHPSLSFVDEEGHPYTVFLDVPGDVLETIGQTNPHSSAVQAQLRPLAEKYVEPGQPFMDRHTLRRLLEHEREDEELDLGGDLTLTRSQVAIGVLVFGALLLLIVTYGMFAG